MTSPTAAAAANDLRLYQWRLDGVTWQSTPAAAFSADLIYPTRDYNNVTPSRYATALQTSFKTQAQTAGQIRTMMNMYPGMVVVVIG